MVIKKEDIVKIFKENIGADKISYCVGIKCEEDQCPLFSRCPIINEIGTLNFLDSTGRAARNIMIKEYVKVHRNLEQW